MDREEDDRLLVPFTEGGKIGFKDYEGKVVAEARFAKYDGECYERCDLIRVAVADIDDGGNVNAGRRPLYGLMDYTGKMILEPQFFSLVSAIGNKQLFTAQNKDYEYGVIRADGEEVVPFGSYDWIDGFDKGLARVKIGKAPNKMKNNGNKWGLINDMGDVALPVCYDDIWNFYGKERYNTNVVLNGVTENVIFSYVRVNEYTDAHSRRWRMKRVVRFGKDTGGYSHDYDYDYDPWYESEFANSYAQYYAGYDDDTINAAFDGDPDMYWNID